MAREYEKCILHSVESGACIIDCIKHNTPEEAAREAEAEAAKNQNCFSVSDFSKVKNTVGNFQSTVFYQDKNINRQFMEV